MAVFGGLPGEGINWLTNFAFTTLTSVEDRKTERLEVESWKVSVV